MKRETWTLIAAAVILLLLATPIVFAEDAEADPGKAAFLNAKCNMCHTVASAGIEAKVKVEKMKGPDLVRVTVDDQVLMEFLRKRASIDDKPHKNEFKGTDEELRTVIAWLKQLPAG